LKWSCHKMIYPGGPQKIRDQLAFVRSIVESKEPCCIRCLCPMNWDSCFGLNVSASGTCAWGVIIFLLLGGGTAEFTWDERLAWEGTALNGLGASVSPGEGLSNSVDEVLTFGVKIGASVEACLVCFLLAGVGSPRVVGRPVLEEIEEQPLSKCSLIVCAGTLLLHTGLQIQYTCSGCQHIDRTRYAYQVTWRPCIGGKKEKKRASSRVGTLLSWISVMWLYV
jgi:hypothetical protein